MGAAEHLSEYISEAEYLAAERRGQERHEYLRGEVSAMAGGSYTHGYIIDNLVMHLNRRLAGRGCRASSANTRLHIPVFPLYAYPDVMVVCGKPQFLDNVFDTILNPTLLIEVLSPSTRRYDLSEKAARYRAIPSLQHYLAVDSTEPGVTLHTRTERPGEWLLTDLTDAHGVIRLAALDIDLPMAEVYEGIDFGPMGLRVS